MIIHNGTPQGMKLIDELKADSLLVDFYDQSFQANSGKFPAIPEDAFLRFDKEHGTNYRNHLLGIYIPPNFSPKKLLQVYPPLKSVFKDADFPPVFIFINLAMQRVWVIKQTRKGSAIIVDVQNSQIFDEEIFESNSPIKEFLELDYAKIVMRLYKGLEKITRADCNLHHGYGTQKELREAVSWNLPNIKNIFPKTDIAYEDLIRNY